MRLCGSVDVCVCVCVCVCVYVCVCVVPSLVDIGAGGMTGVGAKNTVKSLPN